MAITQCLIVVSIGGDNISSKPPQTLQSFETVCMYVHIYIYIYTYVKLCPSANTYTDTQLYINFS